MRPARTLVAVLCFFFVAFPCQADDTTQGIQLGSRRLTDYRGAEFSLDDLMKEKKGLVLAFVGTDCPLVKSYSPRLMALESRLSALGIGLVGIDSNIQDSLAEIAGYAKDFNISFPILKDADHALADAVGARRTPEVVLLDAQWSVRYMGRIDDQFGIGTRKPVPLREDLFLAAEELSLGKEISVAKTDSLGCLIGRSKRTPTEGAVTYYGDVATILQRRCAECHRAGEIGPMELTRYEDASAWGETILEVVDQGRMPPWFADPKIGKFMHDPQLSDDEKKKLRDWVVGGCAEGDPALASSMPKPNYVDGWQMGQVPDRVYYTDSKPYKIPAEGELDYVYYTIDSGFTEDTWITGAEARAGNRGVVHHILVFCNRPGKWYPAGLPGELISAYAPGMKPTVSADESMALLIPKGSKIIMQIHYTPNGRPQEDRSFFGLQLAKDPSKIKWEIKPGMAINVLFRIPAHADNYRVPGFFSFPEDAILLGVNPHMHMRGKSFLYEALYPDGRKETIMHCPKYDFNWQLGYQYEKPIRMPKGTKILCNAWYDNSENNPSNPNPNVAVGFGDQTWDEMMIGWFYYAVPNRAAIASAK
ncbi:redoxin family protein [bacterium]|nr:redoxin family protein [bacterium]